jgi:hypothetical protein
MERTGLIRLGGLAVMVGSAVFALVLLLRPSNGPIFFLLLVVVGVAVAAFAALLMRTRYSKLAVLASAGPWVGLALTAISLPFAIQNFDALIPTFTLLIGASLLIVALGTLVVLCIATNVLRWWGSVALVVGPLIFYFASTVFFSPSVNSLIGVAWIMVGYAIFRAATRQTQQPSRVQVEE